MPGPHTTTATPDFEMLQFSEQEEGDQRIGGPAWLDGTPQDDEALFSDHENKYSSDKFDGGNGAIIQQLQQRPRSKADLRREDLLSAAFRATT